MNKPLKPGKNADQKALNAYYSELRRWAQNLAEWEQNLTAREAALEEECDCSPEDAMDGCECPTCENWRSANPAAMRIGSNYVDMTRRQVPQSLMEKYVQPKAQPVGDEIVFLDKLFSLKDKRKKKK